jgi:serine/threonine protein phosphatase PrpC
MHEGEEKEPEDLAFDPHFADDGAEFQIDDLEFDDEADEDEEAECEAAGSAEREPSEPGGDDIVAFVSDVGLKRENNEDSMFCDPERGLFVVCDGVGGSVAGERASQEAVRSIAEHITPERIAAAAGKGDEAVRKLLRDALAAADDSIVALIQADPSFDGMATTVVAGLRIGGMVYVANLGDSRAYRIRGGAIIQFSTDHSVAAALVALGAMTKEEARGHYLRNQITGALGGESEEDPAYAVMPVEPGDRLVFCSDGLWDYVDEPEIAETVTQMGDARDEIRSMLRSAYDAGAPDNVTAIVVHIR